MESILTNAAADRLLACPDGTRLSVPGDPSCCDSTCPTWARFVPCGTFTCAGDEGPSSGPPFWLCITARCIDVFNENNLPESIVGRPNLIVLVGGVCYRLDTPVQQVPSIDQIPPGETVITDTLFSCRTGGCASCEGQTSGWARATPCDPTLGLPPVYFCKATLQRPCVVTAAFGGACHRYRADAPERQPTPGAVLVRFPPDYQWDIPPWNYGSCCLCGCAPNPAQLPPIACSNLGPWPNTGCCNDLLYQAGRVFARIDYWIRQDFGNQSLTAHIRGFGDARAVPCTRREIFIFNGQQIYDDTVTIESYRVPCPAAMPIGNQSGVQLATIFPQGPELESCTEHRQWDRWRWSQFFRPSAAETRETRGEVRLFQPDREPCSNYDCLGTFTPIPRPPGDAGPDLPVGPMPATGSDGGRVTIRGGGSRAIDPAVAAILEQQSRGGGCAGCGGGWGG